MDDDDTLPMIPSFDRVSIPAILLLHGDVPQAARSAGIHEPVEIPAILGDDAGIMLGDGFTPNLTGVFEPEETGDGDFDERHSAEPDASGT
ncbi:MAG TPA: hypothetical protein VFG62_20350 [Rhodopila sp.]|nr:hypothetical protein [Rhodopila sp.]